MSGLLGGLSTPMDLPMIGREGYSEVAQTPDGRQRARSRVRAAGVAVCSAVVLFVVAAVGVGLREGMRVQAPGVAGRHEGESLFSMPSQVCGMGGFMHLPGCSTTSMTTTSTSTMTTTSTTTVTATETTTSTTTSRTSTSTDTTTTTTLTTTTATTTIWLSKIKFTGCFKHNFQGMDKDEFHNSMPRPVGYTTSACVRACSGYKYILLKGNGFCACHSMQPSVGEYMQLEEDECGPVCETEETLFPKRYCGTDSTYAVYSIESPTELQEELQYAQPGEKLFFEEDVAHGWPTRTRDQWPPKDGKNASTVDAPKKRVMKGVAYGPVPLRSIGHLPDDDFMADSVKAMWSTDGRGDLAIIRALGANSVRLYGNDPSLDHSSFLDEAMSQGLEVIAGISDYPYTQMPGNCLTTNFDCYHQVKQQYMQNLRRGFLAAGNVYHPALKTIILMNEPDLKFPGGPDHYVKAVISAFDAVLDVEKEVGIAGQAPTLTATFSFGVCGEGCPEYGKAPALGQMLSLRRGMMHPEKVGYRTRNDIWAAYQTRFVNSMNTANPALDLPWLFLDNYDKMFPRTPVFIGEYHSPRTVDQKRDLEHILSIARNESSMLTGVMFFEFQVRYDKGGSEMAFGMFGLESRAVADVSIGWKPFTAYCLKPLEVAEIAGRTRQNDCGAIEAGVDYVTDGAWSLKMDHVPEPAFCCKYCKDNPQCVSWTWFEDARLDTPGSPSQCVLKGGLPTGKIPKDGVVSGVPYGTEDRVPALTIEGRRRLRGRWADEGDSAVEAGNRQLRFGQCGGAFWLGPTECPTDFVCRQRTEYFSQCLPQFPQDGDLGFPPGSSTAVPHIYVHQAVAAAYGGEGIRPYQMCPIATTGTTTTEAPATTTAREERHEEVQEQQEEPEAQADDAAAVTTVGQEEEQEERSGDEGPTLMFYGCYLAMLGSTVASNEQGGYTSATCTGACGGFVFALLHNGGRCSCSNTKPEMSLLSMVDASLCGEVCDGEADLEPKRFCGGAQTFAVYEALQPTTARRRLVAA